MTTANTIEWLILFSIYLQAFLCIGSLVPDDRKFPLPMVITPTVLIFAAIALSILRISILDT